MSLRASPLVIAPRYKTKLCDKFATSSGCPYGESCMYAHGDDELRTRRMNVSEGLTTRGAVRARVRSTQILAPAAFLPSAPAFATQHRGSCHMAAADTSTALALPATTGRTTDASAPIRVWRHNPYVRVFAVDLFAVA